MRLRRVRSSAAVPSPPLRGLLRLPRVGLRVGLGGAAGGLRAQEGTQDGVRVLKHGGGSSSFLVVLVPRGTDGPGRAGPSAAQDLGTQGARVERRAALAGGRRAVSRRSHSTAVLSPETGVVHPVWASACAPGTSRASSRTSTRSQARRLGLRGADCGAGVTGGHSPPRPRRSSRRPRDPPGRPMPVPGTRWLSAEGSGPCGSDGQGSCGPGCAVRSRWSAPRGACGSYGQWSGGTDGVWPCRSGWSREWGPFGPGPCRTGGSRPRGARSRSVSCSRPRGEPLGGSAMVHARPDPRGSPPGRAGRTTGAGVAAGNVRPVTTPGTLPRALDSARAGATPTRRTGRKTQHVRYGGFRPARREHAPDAAPSEAP